MIEPASTGDWAMLKGMFAGIAGLRIVVYRGVLGEATAEPQATQAPPQEEDERSRTAA
jgi:hypothetical protein